VRGLRITWWEAEELFEHLTETYQIDDGDGYMDDMERSVDFLVNATFGDVIYIERVDK
jgi:hypothetical protein